MVDRKFFFLYDYRSDFQHWFHNEHFTLIPILLIIIVVCLLTMILILMFVLFLRSKRKKEYKSIYALKSDYQTRLINYLYEESEREKELEEIRKLSKDKMSRKVLINEMIDLSINLSGEPKRILRNLYMSVGLHEDSIEKAYANKWHIKIKGFRELAFMDIHDANIEIRRCLNSSNPILRMEAQLALVRLNEEDPFQFLDYVEEHFTIWEQMNVYETIIYHELPIPDFSRWLNCDNKSVVIFSLRMIKLFKQNDAVYKLLQMVDYPDHDVRHELYQTLGALEKDEIRNILKNQFLTESQENKLIILQSLGRFRNENDIEFFKRVIEENDEVEIQIQAAKGIRSTGTPGKNELKNLVTSDNYRNYQIIIKHVLDERL
jgi:competence protein ComGC